MKLKLIKILSTVAAFGIATSGYSLNIIPTFDSSITSATNAAAITNAIYLAIGVLQSNISDNVPVRITFVSDESVGLGQSTTFGDDFAYVDFIAALRLHAVGARDITAISKLPISTTDPVMGGTQIHLTTAQERVLGLDTNYDGPDSTVSCKMSLMNFTRPGIDPDKYDLAQVLEHEMDEVLGISSSLPNTTKISPADLFRYTTNLARTYTTNGDDAYFSLDGTNLLARYNMDPGGDYGDWWSVANNWSPTAGVTSFPQVQDAFSSPGVVHDLGPAELAIIDVVGWTVASTTVTPRPTLKIVASGANQFTLSWTNTATGFVLQERTNLASTNWAFSASGSTNPAIVTFTNSAKFFRLYKPASSSQSPARQVAVSAPHGPKQVTVRSIFPHQP